MSSNTSLEARVERRLTAEYVAARALAESAHARRSRAACAPGACAKPSTGTTAPSGTSTPARDVLRCVEPGICRPSRVPEFEAISRRTVFARGMGLPGRVWASGEPAWIPDVVDDPNFPRASIASREGLHGAFALPILVQRQVVGVMEFFSREIREPEEGLLRMLTQVGAQIGQFMERKRAEEELDRFFTLSLDLMCVAGFDGYFKRVNPAWERVLGYTSEKNCSRARISDFVHPDDRNPTTTEADSSAPAAR